MGSLAPPLPSELAALGFAGAPNGGKGPPEEAEEGDRPSEGGSERGQGWENSGTKWDKVATKMGQKWDELYRFLCYTGIVKIPGPLLFDILGRSESALWELGCAQIHGGLPPVVRRPLGLQLGLLVLLCLPRIHRQSLEFLLKHLSNV